jgi:L-fuculose-phosphate aldolase
MIGVEAKLIEDLLNVSRTVANRGWAPGSSGNTSVRISGSGLVLIKATGKSMNWIEPESILKVDLAGNILAGEGRPSKEIRFHLGIYSRREDIGGVIHAHPPFATSWAIAGLQFPLLTAPGKTVLKKVPMVDFAPSGSIELATMVTKTFEDRSVSAVLLKGHGVVAAGKTIYDAFNIMEWTEDAARVALLTAYIEKLGLSKTLGG